MIDRPSRTTRGRHWTVGAVAAATGALALAAPAAAMPTGAGVRAGHNISVFATIDFIGAFGYSVGTPMTVEVLRGGHSITRVTALTNSTPDGGALEVNHGPLGAPQPGDCWEGFTADIRPGDVVRVTADAGIDEVMVDNIRIDQGPTATAPGVFEMKGVAERGDGTPIPVAELNSGELRNTSKFRVAPNEVTRTVGTTNGWTASFHAPFNVERNGLGADPLQAIPSADVIGMGFGHVVPLPAETQLADGVGDLPGPALGCEGSPLAANGIGSASVQALNVAALGAVAAGDVALEVGGPAAQDVSSATITLSDGTKAIDKPAEGLAGGAASLQGFTARFTRAEVESLSDGTLTLSGTFGGAAGVARKIVKDTVAPTILNGLAPGSYTGTQRAVLDIAGADKVTYRTDGRPARASDQIHVGDPIELQPGDRTLTVLAVDAAGNATTASYAYAIAARSAPAAPAAAPVTAPPARLSFTAPPNRSLRVASLRVRQKLRRAEAKRSGVRVAMRLAKGTRMVRLSVYRRLSRRGFDLVGRALRVPGKGGGYSVRLNDPKLRRALKAGRYVVEVTPGGASGRLSEADSRNVSFRVV